MEPKIEISMQISMAHAAPGNSVGLTVIITTSPTPSAPSTGLIAAVSQSFRTHCPELLACPVIVILDTFDHVGAQPRLKKGVVTDEGAGHHDAYKQNVKRLVLAEYRRPRPDRGDGGDAPEPLVESRGQAEYGLETEANSVDLLISRTRDGRVTFVEPSKRLGFGLGVRSGLRLAGTPYVWIQQHDWPLAADIPVRSILRVMDDGGRAETAAAPVKYVCLPSVRMRSYATSDHVVKFPALRALTASLRSPRYVTDADAAVPLTPLFFWHDKPHLASTAHYLDRVFPTRLAMPRGAFIEDLVGQRARDQMKEGNWARWACWLYYPDDGKRLCVRHLQGRTRRGGPGEAWAG